MAGRLVNGRGTQRGDGAESGREPRGLRRGPSGGPHMGASALLRVGHAGTAALTLLALACATLTALVIGASSVGAGDVLALVTGGDLSPMARNILINMRIPRVAAGLLAGASLAVAGAVIQSVLDNPLASPNVIGVNGGAGLAVLVAATIPALGATANPAVLPLASFIGALTAAAVVFAISARTGVSRLTVVLAGVAINAVCGAGQNAILSMAPKAYLGSSSFLVGGFSGVLLGNLAVPCALSLVGFLVALALAPSLQVLSLGSESAHALGVPVTAVRLIGLTAGALLAASAVSFAGLIGFVGLVVPHIVRRVFGSDVRRLIPLCAAWGATFTVACDTFARTAFAPYELAVGIPLAFIGGPFFIYLIMRGRGYRDE